MSRKNILITTATIAVCLAFFLLIISRPRLEPPQAVRIALNLPLSGPIAAFSGDYPNAFLMGIEDGAADSGLNPEVFAIDIQDNQGQPRNAVSVFQTQELRGFQVYISGTSEISKAIAPNLDVLDTPHFLVAFDAFLATNAKNRLRILPHYRVEAPLYIAYARQRKAKQVAMLGLNISSITEQFTEIVEPGLREANIPFYRETFDFDTSDYRTLVERLLRSKPDLIIVSGFSFHIRPILDALRSRAFVHNHNVICTMDFIDLVYDEQVNRSSLTDVAFIVPDFELNLAGDAATRWRDAYHDRFGKRPKYVEAYAYDTGRIIAQAFANQGDVSLQSIASALPRDGIVGHISLDAEGDLEGTLRIGHVTENGDVAELP